jgi:threonine dehydrogenase-like Zn-dependent dehydrogenase
MEPIRVATFARPVIQTVPWPKIPNKAALIKVGACGVCGTDLHILKGTGRNSYPGLSRSDTKSAVCLLRSAANSPKISLRLGALSEPLTSCIRAFNRAIRADGFKWGDTVVIQGSGPIGILAVAAAQEMGAGRVICVGAPETPRLALARKFGADLPLGVEMLDRTRNKYPWLEMQTLYPFTEHGISNAVADAIAMKTVKSTIVPRPELVE